MLIYFILFLIAFLFSRFYLYIPCSICIALSGLYLYYKDYKKTKKIINLRGIFFLSFLCGMALSALKLSYLQKQWENLTWLSFLLIIIVFYYSYEIFDRITRKFFCEYKEKRYKPNRLAFSIICITFIALFSFIIEAKVLGYIPFLIRGVPHAYSYFHISGLHYFTVSCVLVPSLSIIYFYIFMKERNKKFDIVIIISNIISLAIPILLVSRFQFIFSILLALISFVSIKKDIRIINIIISIIFIIPVYIILSIARSHNIEYLNSIFEMRKAIPIYISQPYIYIANNYDNFNELVKNITKHSFGLKTIFPLLALTGLKFKLANLLSFPLFVTKKELTTLTIIYDAYYDFGLLGIVIFGIFLGFISNILENIHIKNPIFHLIYAQICVYFLLSFFSTWFSNPATWFYLSLSIIIYLFVNGRKYDF